MGFESGFDFAESGCTQNGSGIDGALATFSLMREATPERCYGSFLTGDSHLSAILRCLRQGSR